MSKQKKQTWKRLTPFSQEEADITASDGNSSKIIISIPNPTGGLLQAKRLNLQQQMNMLMKGSNCQY